MRRLVRAALLAPALLVAGCGHAPPPNGEHRVTATVVAEDDPRLGARIVRCEPLVYSDPAPDELDRPPHVRAASGIVRVGGELVVVQDDASFVAVRRADGRVEAIALPAGHGGRRRFEAALGNKEHKLDLESAILVTLEGAPRVLAFGSGSSPRRESIAVVDVTGRAATLRPASELYARLREERAFSGSELNVEGAVVAGGVLRLFSRGNGAPRDGLEPIDATVDVDLGAFLEWLLERGPLPPLTNVRRYELGAERHVRYGFTDAAALLDGRIVYAAGAEDSPDAIEDGEVLGARIGVFDERSVRSAPLRDEDGRPTTAKVEGLAASADPGRLFAVTDTDDPERPALLCEIELTGPW